MKPVLVLLLSVLVLPSIACKTKYTIILEGGTSLNSSTPPSEAGTPTPVKARIYQLKDSDAFTTKSFDEIWDNAKSLGADLLDEKQQPTAKTVVPMEEGKSKEYKRITVAFLEEQSLNTQTKFFGVAALFKPEGESTAEQKSKWKAVVSIDDVKGSNPNKIFELNHFELTIKEN